jgi:hypothetical protein
MRTAPLVANRSAEVDLQAMSPTTVQRRRCSEASADAPRYIHVSAVGVRNGKLEHPAIEISNTELEHYPSVSVSTKWNCEF